MTVSELIDNLKKIKEEYGDIEVVGYDYSAYNMALIDSDVTGVEVFFSDEEGKDYAEIGFLPRGIARKTEA